MKALLTALTLTFLAFFVVGPITSLSLWLIGRALKKRRAGLARIEPVAEVQS